jgi:hypothetical protein
VEQGRGTNQKGEEQVKRRINQAAASHQQHLHIEVATLRSSTHLFLSVLCTKNHWVERFLSVLPRNARQSSSLRFNSQIFANKHQMIQIKLLGINQMEYTSNTTY